MIPLYSSIQLSGRADGSGCGSIIEDRAHDLVGSAVSSVGRRALGRVPRLLSHEQVSDEQISRNSE